MSSDSPVDLCSNETHESPPVAGDRPGALTNVMTGSSIWNDKMLEDSGIPIQDAGFVSVGGGIGSFVTIDYLRIYGVPLEQLRVLTPVGYPWQRYEYLARASQIPVGERIRSDSTSRPDCIWGFPSFALSEAFHAKSVRGFVAPLCQVLVEPIFTDFYTPRAGHVFRMLQREADRISYKDTVERGSVQMVRRRAGGGYFTLITPAAEGAASRPVAVRSRFVHLAVGYPGINLLANVQEYRQRYGDFSRVVHAYEPHDFVYEALAGEGGTVLVRGGGIVASRILQRLIEDRDREGRNTTIYHLLRTYVAGPHGSSVVMRRRGGHGWAHQGFNVPKSAWGGQLKSRMRSLEGQDREALYKAIGGTTTARRKVWNDQLARGRREGLVPDSRRRDGIRRPRKTKGNPGQNRNPRRLPLAVR
jgi:hypothetical protein